jgi:hypothetical protein
MPSSMELASTTVEETPDWFRKPASRIEFESRRDIHSDCTRFDVDTATATVQPSWQTT